jgi:hypothetical protein
MLERGPPSERAYTAGCCSEGVMGTGFLKHKPKKSDAKRAERCVPQPRPKPAVVEKAKPTSKPPPRKS